MTGSGAGKVFRTDNDAEYFFEEGCYILELCNDPGDPELSVARARVPAGEGTRWHKLEGTTERYLILHGSGEVYVDDFVRAVEPGDVVLIPAGARQKIHNTGSEELVFLALCTPRFERACYRDLAASGASGKSVP